MALYKALGIEESTCREAFNKLNKVRKKNNSNNFFSKFFFGILIDFVFYLEIN